MVLAAIADVHLGRKLSSNYGDLRRLLRKVFSEMVDRILDKPPDLLLIAGDLFDTRRPEIDDLSFAIEKIRQLAEEGIDILYIAGNHELPLPRSGKSSLLVLFDKISNRIKIVDKLPDDVVEIGGYRILALPHAKVTDSPGEKVRIYYHRLLRIKEYDLVAGHLCVDGFGEYSAGKDESEDVERSCIESSHFKAFGIFGHYHKFLKAPDYIFVGSSVAVPLHIFTPKNKSREPKSFYITYRDGKLDFASYNGIPLGKFELSNNFKEFIDYLDRLQRGIVRVEVESLTSQLEEEIIRIASRYEDIVLLIRTKPKARISVKDLIEEEEEEENPEEIVKSVFDSLLRGKSAQVRNLLGLAYKIYNESREDDLGIVAQMALDKILEALGVREDENP